MVLGSPSTPPPSLSPPICFYFCLFTFMVEDSVSQQRNQLTNYATTHLNSLFNFVLIGIVLIRVKQGWYFRFFYGTSSLIRHEWDSCRSCYFFSPLKYFAEFCTSFVDFWYLQKDKLAKSNTYRVFRKNWVFSQFTATSPSPTSL